MEAIPSSESSSLERATRRNIPEGDILHNHRCENLKTHIALNRLGSVAETQCLLWGTNWDFVSQKTFFIVTSVKTSKLTPNCLYFLAVVVSWYLLIPYSVSRLTCIVHFDIKWMACWLQISFNSSRQKVPIRDYFKRRITFLALRFLLWQETKCIHINAAWYMLTIT
jgi:hypothetical protein